MGKFSNPKLAFVLIVFLSLVASNGLASDAVTEPVAQDVTEPAASDLTLNGVTDFNQLDLNALLDIQVETASKKKETISQAPAIIEVLTREQLYRLGARDLYSALTFLPGVELIEPFGGVPTLIFRGAFQEQYSVTALLLINGHASYEPLNSTFYLETIPFDAVDRIEVIRGPGSVLYGNNAFAGVINVITTSRAEAGSVSRLRAEGGQFTTFGGGGGNAGRWGGLSWSAFAGANNSRGYPYRIAREQNEDCIPNSPFGPNAAAAAASDCSGTHTLSYFNNYANAHLQVEYRGLKAQAGGLFREKQKYGFLPVLRFNGVDEATYGFGDVFYGAVWDNVSATIRAGVNRDQRNWNVGRFPEASFPETHFELLSNLYRGEATLNWKSRQFTFDQGISYELGILDRFSMLDDAGNPHKFSPDFHGQPRQDTVSWFGQAGWAILESTSLVAGVRVSRFQTTTVNVKLDSNGIPSYSLYEVDPMYVPSPRGGLVFTPRENLTFKVLYGEAFRFPNLTETNAVINQLSGIEEGTRHQTIRTAELGVDSRPVQWMSLRVNAYYSYLDDLLGHRLARDATEAAKLGPQAQIYENMFEQRVFGVELSTKAIVSERLDAFANASWKNSSVDEVDPRNVELAGPYKRTTGAPVIINGGLSWRPSPWLRLHPNAQYVGPRGYAKAYTLLNLVAEVPVTSQVSLSLIGNNLLDQEYFYPETVRRYVKTLPGGPGRQLYGRVMAEF